MLRRFRLEEPQSIDEASDLLGRFGESAKIYAGGTELLLAMKEGLVEYERLINIKGVKGLDAIARQNGSIQIGSLCTHRQLENASVLREVLPALVKLEENVANVRVRQVGTLGGNLCFAEPHADPGTLLLALGSTLVLEKARGRREMPVDAFLVDAYETALEQDEVLTRIVIPVPAERSGVCYMKFGYLERPSVGVAVALGLDADRHAVNDIRIAVGCAGPAPRRVQEAEELLKRTTLEEASRNLARAGEISGSASRAISDLHGSQDYKEHIVGVLLRRCFQNALSQC